MLYSTSNEGTPQTLFLIRKAPTLLGALGLNNRRVNGLELCPPSMILARLLQIERDSIFTPPMLLGFGVPYSIAVFCFFMCQTPILECIRIYL